MKKVIVFIAIMSTVLTGCWDMTEPEKIGFVTVLGIDLADNNQIRLVIHEMSQQKPSSDMQMGSSGGGSSVKLHEATAPTMTKAIHLIFSSDFRRTYFAHASAIIISEELADSEGIGPVLDSLERNPDLKQTMWLLIAKKGNFDKIFSTGAGVESGTNTGKIIEEIIANRLRNSFLLANNLNDFLTLYWEKGSEPFSAGISLSEVPAKASRASGKKNSAGNSYDFHIESTAVFNNDRLSGWLDNEESLGLKWVTSSLKGGIVSVKLKGSDVDLRILRSVPKIKPSITDGKIKININVFVKSNIIESRANIDYDNTENINKLQELQAEEIKRQILTTINKTKSMNSDVFGFGNYIFGKYPKYWKTVETSWSEQYRDIDVSIEVDSIVSHIGIIRKTKEES